MNAPPQQNFWEKAAELERAGLSFVTVTLIAIKGHAPQNVGAKICVTHEGLQAGTVGGGKVEAQCIDYAIKMLAPGSELKSIETVHWNLQQDVGMTCGGTVTFLFEHVQPAAWHIVIFGAGHVGQAIATLLSTLRARVTFVDNRSDWLSGLPKTSRLEIVHEPHLPDYVVKVAKTAHFSAPYFVIMTQGHATDVPVLLEVIKYFPDAPYFGVIGSKVKAIKIRAELKEAGIADAIIEKFRCPMGLSFGTNDPAEIAVSITAELLQVRDQMISEQMIQK